MRTPSTLHSTSSHECHKRSGSNRSKRPSLQTLPGQGKVSYNSKRTISCRKDNNAWLRKCVSHQFPDQFPTFQVVCLGQAWPLVPVLLGCLWIACKLEEGRLGLPSAQQMANLAGPSLSGFVTAAVISAAEIQVMGLLRWQPLAGWDDAQHCKGVRMLAMSSL